MITVHQVPHFLNHPLQVPSYNPMSHPMSHPGFMNGMTAMSKPQQMNNYAVADAKNKPMTPGSKRRASRAGTRSVATLTAAQLERKRANDRE